MSDGEKGVLTGAGLGAVGGAAITAIAGGNAAVGAAVGGAAGAVAGGIIGGQGIHPGPILRLSNTAKFLSFSKVHLEGFRVQHDPIIRLSSLHGQYTVSHL